MMASPPELSLECKTQSYSMLLKSFGVHSNPHDLAKQKLEEYLNRLEEERLKVDAFKRELPLCMQLLANAMEASRQQLQSYKENQGTRPVLEEFIPLKNSYNAERSDHKPANISDKANWMTSAQLWSQTGDENNQPVASIFPKVESDHINFNNGNPTKLSLETQRNRGAFLPFSKDQCSIPKSANYTTQLPKLALASGEEKRQNNDSENGSTSSENSSKGGNVVEYGNKATDSQITTTTNNQTQRKARRSWSPDLHRRFVNALQMLGGPQVATPKQIRELMKVDGLTNDEVKSHLQKYRLHTRRPSQQGSPTQQIVVLGGIWVPPEYTNTTAGGPTMYSSHPASSQVTPHYCSTIVPQDFYSTAPLPTSQPLLHHPGLQQHHQYNQQLHVYKTSSHTQTHSSPESDTRGVGEWSECIEDGKSENNSWKAEGECEGEGEGEGGSERKKLAAMRDSDGQESNEGEITLNF